MEDAWERARCEEVPKVRTCSCEQLSPILSVDLPLGERWCVRDIPIRKSSSCRSGLGSSFLNGSVKIDGSGSGGHRSSDRGFSGAFLGVGTGESCTFKSPFSERSTSSTGVAAVSSWTASAATSSG